MLKYKLETIRDLEDAIHDKYPKIKRGKILTVKIGKRIYLYMVTKSNLITREYVFDQRLDLVKEHAMLARLLDVNIYKALSKHGLIKKDPLVEKVLKEMEIKSKK